MKFLSSLILISVFFFNEANGQPQKLVLKHKLEDVRFLSHDGKFFYYQKPSGSIHLSEKFQVSEIMSREKNTQYFMSSSPARKKIILEVAPNYYSRNSLLAENEIFFLSYGGREGTKVGNGIHPKLHLSDNWISYYQPKDKKIAFYQTVLPNNQFSIDLTPMLNRYFVPQVVMISDTEILYTAENSQGAQGIFVYDRKKGDFTLVRKNTSYGQRFELCFADQTVWLFQTGIQDVKRGSSLSHFEAKSPFFFDEKKFKTVYYSDRNDLGQIICQFKKDHVYFIKNTSPDTKKIQNEQEVVEHNLKENKTTPLTTFQYVNQLLLMDQRLLTLYQGDYYILAENAQLYDDKLQEDKNVEKTRTID